MNDVVALVLLAFAVSLDSFTVGLTYGIRKVTIPTKSLIIILLCTFFILMVAMGIGSFIELFISYEAAEKLGGAILIGIGIWVLYQFFTSQKNDAETGKEYKVIEFEIKPFSVIVKILKKPMEADFDKSGSISSIEALFLGTALSLDAFGAGIGAALIDLPPILFPIVITISSMCFVLVGINIGKIIKSTRWMKSLTVLPGLALIALGLFKM